MLFLVCGLITTKLEPLTAFFILEGLAFDIIGAIFIIRGLFDFNKDDKLETNAVLANRIRAIFKLMRGNSKALEPTPEELVNNLMKLPEFLKKTNMTMKNVFYETDIDEDLHKSQMMFLKKDYYETKKFSQNSVISGLSFLVGGFLLQGIGVITQL